MTNDDTDHLRQLLTIHLRRLLVLGEELTKNPKDVILTGQINTTRSELNQCAEQLGLGTLPAALRAITEAAGLRAETIGSFRRQRQHIVEYKKAIELQKINASPADKATLMPQLQQAAECLTTIDQQLAELGVSCHQQQADQFLAKCATISWPATALRNAFRRIFPYHRLPESGEDALLRSILTELVDNPSSVSLGKLR